MAFHQYFSASTLLTFWPDTFLMQGQSWTCEVSEHVQVSWTSQVSTHQCLNASMTSAPAVTTKHTCTCGPVSLGGRSCLQPLAHMIQSGLFPTQPPWPQVSHTEASFFLLGSSLNTWSTAPPQAPCSLSSLGLGCSSSWALHGSMAFSQLSFGSVQMSLKGEFFCYRPMWWLPWGFPGGADSKEPTCNAGDLIPRLGRSLGEGNGYPL